jgi:hypothetical protein
MAYWTEFPRQSLPAEKKDYDWHLDCVNAILSYNRDHFRYVNERKKDHENFLIAEGYFDTKQFEYVTDMYGLTAPARLVNYPIIQPKLDLLAGELISQPLEFTINVVNRSAIRRKNDTKIAVAAEMLMRPIRKALQEELGVEMQDEEVGMEIPEDIETFSKMRFRDAMEDQAHVGLQFLIQKYNLKQVFKRGFYDMGKTNKEFYHVYIKNGDPFVEKCDPRAMIYDVDSDKETLQHALYAGIENYYTPNEIIDIYNHKLDPDQVEYIEEIARQDSQWFDEHNSVFDNYIHEEGRSLKIRVVKLQWRSIRMLKWKVSENKFDPEVPYYKMLKDDYKPKKGEKIEIHPITEIRQAVKIGHEMLLDFGPKPNQLRFEENYAETTLDFYGIIRNNSNGQTLSVVDALKNIQILYNIVMYHIELTMARAGGKSIVYDVSQKPKKTPLSDVFYHAKNSGLILINSKQEGQQLSSFNQFQQIDFTLSNSVQQLINLKMMLEETADKLTGISAARSGITKSGDLVGVTERNVLQSTTITAPLFEAHYQVVGDVLQALVNLMRIAWANEGRMANIFGDTGMKTFEIDKGISRQEFGLFIQNNAKEAQDKRTMLGLIDRYSSTGNIDPLSAVKAVRADSAMEIEKILESALDEVRAQQVEMQEREIAAQEAKNQIDGQKIQIPLQVAQINSQTDIQVAQINAQAKLESQGSKERHEQDMSDINHKHGLDELMLDASNQEAAMNNLVDDDDPDQIVEVRKR